MPLKCTQHFFIGNTTALKYFEERNVASISVFRKIKLVAIKEAVRLLPSTYVHVIFLFTFDWMVSIPIPHITSHYITVILAREMERTMKLQKYSTTKGIK